MLEIIRQEDTLSRLGGDEFILLSEYTESESGIFTLASRLLNCLKQPFVIGPSKIYINASIGISTYPEDGKTTHELIKMPIWQCTGQKMKVKTSLSCSPEKCMKNFFLTSA